MKTKYLTNQAKEDYIMTEAELFFEKLEKELNCQIPYDLNPSEIIFYQDENEKG